MSDDTIFGWEIFLMLPFFSGPPQKKHDLKWMLHLWVVTTKTSIPSSAVVVPTLKTYVFHIVAHQLTATMSDLSTIAHPGLQKMWVCFSMYNSESRWRHFMQLPCVEDTKRCI